MRILMINVVCGIRSTGRICTDWAEILEKEGHEVKIAYGRELVPAKFQKYAVPIGNSYDARIHAVSTRLFDRHGFGSKRATKQFLEWASEYNPDILWLHNIHGYYLNVEMLFAWIKNRPNMQVKWTLHDCWAFTGHCAHFAFAKCEKWKDHCFSCVQKKRYPTSILMDNCYNNYTRKKAAFTKVENMTIITPSEWLANLVKQSFLKEYPVKVYYNKIDTEVFRPITSDFKKRYSLNEKKIILGVASTWDERKGLDDFVELAKMLDERYVIVLVGLSTQQLENLPSNILGICRTNNIKELAEIYSSATAFVNLTYEDTFPTVNLEALACGTPVITYRTGGSPETIDDNTGVCVEQGDLRGIISAINHIENVSRELCLARSRKFAKNDTHVEMVI